MRCCLGGGELGETPEDQVYYSFCSCGPHFSCFQAPSSKIKVWDGGRSRLCNRCQGRKSTYLGTKGSQRWGRQREASVSGESCVDHRVCTVCVAADPCVCRVQVGSEHVCACAVCACGCILVHVIVGECGPVSGGENERRGQRQATQVHTSRQPQPHIPACVLVLSTDDCVCEGV